MIFVLIKQGNDIRYGGQIAFICLIPIRNSNERRKKCITKKYTLEKNDEQTNGIRNLSFYGQFDDYAVAVCSGRKKRAIKVKTIDSNEKNMYTKQVKLYGAVHFSVCFEGDTSQRFLGPRDLVTSKSAFILLQQSTFF